MKNPSPLVVDDVMSAAKIVKYQLSQLSLSNYLAEGRAYG